MERVKRLAGNKIELGIEIQQRMLLCGLTDKDLRRICGSQYEQPGSAIGY